MKKIDTERGNLAVHGKQIVLSESCLTPRYTRRQSRNGIKIRMNRRKTRRIDANGRTNEISELSTLLLITDCELDATHVFFLSPLGLLGF